MPAPDLGPVFSPPRPARPLFVHLVPALVAPEALSGSVVVMIDALRASVTIASALASGAQAVFPVLTVEDALEAASRMQGSGARRDQIVLGGERGGVRIPGFDLDNSPLAYTPERVRGKAVVFTTANGTSTLLHAHGAAEILVGALTNLSSVCRAVAAEPRDIHIICSGTRGEISLDDCLAAGAIAERLVETGRELGSDDSGQVCLRLWHDAKRSGILTAMRASRGGRNLVRLGFDADVELCSTTDAVDVLPRYDPLAGAITLYPS
ncbi:MAG: 2-phosphosulfolactate phosphatase [Phycisphaeraceae bacterium]|nr:2-phosphosulfolactate phosphatase [Phycisphaeraceae bacterium]